MSLDRKTLEAVLGLPGTTVMINGKILEVKIARDIESLLKGLTEAGEALGQRVMLPPTTYPATPGGIHEGLHWESYSCHVGDKCTVAPNKEAEAWVARQRKDSHAG